MFAPLKFLKDHLLPHPGNNHHPHLLHHRNLFSMGAMLLMMKAATVIAPILLPGVASQASVITPQNIVVLTNTTRREIKASQLTEDPILDKAAQQKADDMVANSYFGHESPSGKTAMDLILAQGYPAKIAAENLAVRYTEAESVQNSWLLSPTHRENIINPEYKDIGVGVAKGPYKGSNAIFVVQLFGKKLATAAPQKTIPTKPAAVAAGIVNTAQAAEPLTWENAITGTIEKTAQTADMIVVLFVASVLLMMLSVRFHERHLATITHALAVIGIAIVLRMV